MTGITQQSQTGGNTVAPKSVYLGYDGIGDITTIDRSDYVGMGPNPPDAADSTLTYNTLGQLAGITPEHSGVNIDPLSWTYNGLGLPATFTDSNGTATYGYDKDNQVTSVNYTGTGQPANESYTLDADGNRTNNGFQVGTNNQLTTDGTFNYQFDQEGNRTVRTRISSSYATDYKTTYTWDYRNRLTDVDFYDNNNVLTKHVHYTYDVFNNLLSQSVDSTGSGSYNQVTYFVYDLTKPTGFPGQSLDPMAVDAAVLEFVDPDGSGPEPPALAERLLVGPDLAGLMDQVYAQENVSTGAVTWLLPDNLDGTRDAVDSNGNVLGHYVYNSFGQLVSGPTSVTQFLFTGRWTDTNTGLQYNGNRWYDPSVGRWLSEDPADLTYDTNASRYVGNQPTTFIDPTGLGGVPGNGSAPLTWPYSAAAPLAGAVTLAANGGTGSGVIALLAGMATQGEDVAFLDQARGGAEGGAERERRLRPGDPDYLRNGVFVQNRTLGGKRAEDRKNLLTHTYIFTTDENGNIDRTYSWGNRMNDNHSHWFQNQPDDRTAAERALRQYRQYYKTEKLKRPFKPNNWGRRVQDVTPAQVDAAFDELSKPGSPSDHPNGVITNNCKDETRRLLKEAKKQDQPGDVR